jgi:hypothetical protein
VVPRGSAKQAVPGAGTKVFLDGVEIQNISKISFTTTIENVMSVQVEFVPLGGFSFEESIEDPPEYRTQ